MSADGSQPILLPLKGKVIRAADLFCGAGGTSTGAKRAIRELGGTMKLVAVNHWDVAIQTHTRMHPEAAHFCADLESMRPRDAVPGGVLDLLMASPTCTYYSRARGGRPVNDQQRMDPWHVVRWCTELRVHRLLVENVPEMMDWGPCDARTGKPIASRKGEYFRAWLAALQNIGFRIDYKVLCCADYGDPTTRERFFLIGRSDRKPLRWPEPSHVRGGSSDLLGTRDRWRAAAEIINWDMPGKSIFTRKKPLAQNTLRRIHAGAKRYGWPQPHIDALQALIDGRKPVLEIPAGAAEPLLVHFRGTSENAIGNTARSTDDPVPTLTAGGTHLALVMATGSGCAARSASEPVPTITTGGASSTKRPGNARPHLIEPFVFRANQGDGRNGSQRPVSEPLPTATCSESMALAQPLVSSYYGSTASACSVVEPLPTVTTKDRFSIAEPVLIRTDQTGSGPGGAYGTDQPLHTIVTKQNAGLGVPFILPVTHHGDVRVYGIDEPLRTVTGANRGELGIASAGPHIAAPVASGGRVEILYRMLHWRELAGAMSFDDDGEVYDFAGTGTEITKQIGNAVPGRTAKALVRELVRY